MNPETDKDYPEAGDATAGKLSAGSTSGSNSSESHPNRSATENSAEDQRLVESAREGVESSYARLVDKYKNALYFFILKMVREKDQVEDLVQEVFMKAFTSLKSYNSDFAFSTWLYRIASNHTIDYLRKKKLRTLSMDQSAREGEGGHTLPLTDDASIADRDIIKKQRKKIIEKAISDLPEKYRHVIRMRHMEEKSYQEISEILGLPIGTVKVHIFRAREMLYKALKEKRDAF